MAKHQRKAQAKLNKRIRAMLETHARIRAGEQGRHYTIRHVVEKAYRLPGSLKR